MDRPFHTPVLVEDVVRYLITAPDGVYCDGTLGGGGHAEVILRNLTAQGRLIGFDQDEEAVSFAVHRLQPFGDRVRVLRSNFSRIREGCSQLGIGTIQGLLLDLGVSSHQIDDASRGFSFQQSGRLDMRMDRSQSLDGWSVIRTYDEERLTEIFRSYGEERAARRIARKIANDRQKHPVETTDDLAELVGSVVGKQFLAKSLARIFQAIRIEVNGEMERLQTVLRDAMGVVGQGGRIVVISYHSLEDRIVKTFFRDEARTSIPSGHRLLPDRPREPRLRILTNKPVVAGDQEVARNPRARSAKLRAAERIAP
jgi:16S rRNA (cytosine1402-N4)-methyltransferase